MSYTQQSDIAFECD